MARVCARLIQASDRDTFTYGVFRDTLFWNDDTLFGGLPTGQIVFGLLSLFIKETNRTYRHGVPESFQDRRVLSLLSVSFTGDSAEYHSTAETCHDLWSACQKACWSAFGVHLKASLLAVFAVSTTQFLQSTA